ncbi:MAG: efflux RND transporter periplasmic adaptor subunit [Rubrivivax sp.]|nr:efflux RND transporter periplasmic adaptor subunit [Rubrivivax sp.]
MTGRRRWVAGLLGVAVAAVLAAAFVLRQPTPARPTTAALADQAIELAAADVARAGPAELVRRLDITGSLKAVNSAVVKARIAAVVQTLDVREGDRVTAGQRIGQLDATDAQWRLRQAEEQALAAQAQLDIAQRTLANNRALVEQGFISRNALDTSSASAAGAAASLQAARAAAELARKAVLDSEIRAPIAGLVAQRLVQPGERVPLDARLVEIVDLSQLELEAAVPPEDVLALRVGQAARVRIDGLAGPVAARVVRINPSAVAGTRSVMAYLALEPTPGLRQGLFARASIELQRLPALVVPTSALRFDQARPYVLAIGDGRAVQRRVTTGAQGEALIDGRPEPAVEITGGLAEGATVLRGTVGALRDGTRLRLPAAVPDTAGSAAAAASAPTAGPAAATAAR